MAMATNVFLTYPKISTPYSTQHRSRSKRPPPFFHRPPSAFFKIPANCSLSMIQAKLVSALLKEHIDFSGTRNMTDFSRFGLITSENKKWSSRKKFHCQEKKNNDSAATLVSIPIYSFDFQKKLGLCHNTVVPYSSLIYYNTKPSVDQNAENSKIDLGRIALMKALSSKWQYQISNVGDDMFQKLLLMKNALDYMLNSKSTKNILDFLINSGPGYIMMLLQIMQCYYLISVELNRGRLPTSKKSKKQSVTFADVEGVDDAKAELLEIVSCLNKDSNYMKLGAKSPKGVLLTGPPGTGKTLLARACSSEAGVSIFEVAGSEFMETFVGEGARRVRDLFEMARNSAPSIIFIDEIDALGGKRGRHLNSEADHTVNQLLASMDGFNKDDSVVVIASTNRPDTLDPALLRPGRFTKIVVVNAPDQEGRRKIFALHLKNVLMQEDKEYICDYVASNTEGFVGAGLAEIVAESLRVTGRRGGDFVTFDDILQALNRTKSSARANG